MTGLDDLFRAVVGHLEEEGARFALVGGLAVSARTEPRFTRDVDFAVSVASDAEAEALVRALQGRGLRVSAQLEHGPRECLAAVRLVPVGTSGPTVDLMFASSGLEPEIVASADPLEVLPGRTVRVASVGHLLAMKVLSRDDRERPQDRIDALALARAAGHDGLHVARAAVRLISERGFARGRDLAADLEALLRELA